ncbi:MAG: hypothetical protein KF787_04180 [Phycisphaeraceae bacterium]|nr:hypothetical protein [Phycisphaerae bacterium]MBX3391825.1 hypothetical protein [Phycisphaeraceae bacterium]
MRSFNRAAVVVALSGLCGVAGAAINNTGNYFGNVGGQLTAVAFPSVSNATGNFFVGGMPAGSTILAAYVHSNDWFNGGSAHNLIFNGNGMGSLTAYESALSGSGDLFDYRWDVTSQIGGNGFYSFDISGGSQIYMASLHVVYSHPSLPAGSVHTYEGAEHVGEGHTYDFYSFNLTGAAPGPAYFQIVTQADDTNTTGEKIWYNGVQVGGPIDNNLGPYASMISSPVVNNGVSETIAIETFGDWFGLHVALVTTTIPAPGSLALVGLAGLAAARRRR